MSAPVVVRNELTPDTLAPGGAAVWVTEARDPDSGQVQLSRVVRDQAGNTATVVKSLTVLDAVSYEAPTCDDPRVSFEVDLVDPTRVTVWVAA